MGILFNTMFAMKFFSLGVIVAHVMVMAVLLLAAASSTGVDAFSGVVIKQHTRTRQPSQQPSLSSLAYLMREGDDEEYVGSYSTKKKTTVTTTSRFTSIIPTTTTSSGTGTDTINLNNFVEENMIEDLQNQHRQMIQMQQQQVHHHQQQSLHSFKIPSVSSYAPSSSSVSSITAAAIIPSSMTMMSTITAATNNVGGIYDKLHDDLTYINIQLLRSKLSFLHRLLPKNKKQIDRFVNFLIKFIL